MKSLWGKCLSLLLAAGVCAPLVGCGGSAAPGADDDGGGAAGEPVELPPSAVSQIESLLAEKAARTPAQRKIASALLYTRSGRFADAADAKDPAARITSLAEPDARGRMLVDIKGDVAAGDVAAVGGEVVGAAQAHHTTRAWLPLEQLEALAASPAVRSIRPALAAKTSRIDPPQHAPKFRTGSRAERIAALAAAREVWQGPASRLAPELSGQPAPGGARMSEGAKAHGAGRARKLYNTDGTGVKIGVLSDSDDFREQAIASGDLPAGTVAIPGQDGRPGSGEGTAMMEIVHDLAPGAELVFATAFNGPESFADNIRRLRSEYHCDVIVDDIIYFFESPYQDDIIAQAVEDVVADGAVYVSSAGNEGNFNDGTSGTWEGDFQPGGALATLPSGYTVHDFGNRVISDRVEAKGGPLVLHWADPSTLAAPASANDYDLFVLDPSLREVVLASTDLQDGAGMAFEYLGYNIPPGYRVVVARHPNAEARAMRIALFGGELGMATAGAAFGHNSAAGALGVAAIDVSEAADGEFAAGPLTPVELYSSDGPRRVFFRADGTPITPGRLTFGTAGGELRQKPDLAGADGVSTTLPAGSGLAPFFGTSAAAPHVAAIAGLMKAAMPDATPRQIRDALKASALDVEAAGADRDAGVGVAFAPAALQRAGARPAVFLELNAVAVTPVGSDVVLPGGWAELRVQLKNNGGANAAMVRATLVAGSPLATVTRATAAYPTVFAGATGTNPTTFAFTVDPAAPCGARLPFRLEVEFTGRGTHPTVLAFEVQTGRPSEARTVTAYTGPVVAIPDGDLAGVAIPFPAAGSGSIADLRFHVDGMACNADAGATTVGVDHSWVGDLAFKLTAPDGTTVTLLDAPGGPLDSGNNLCQTVLDDAAAASIQDVTKAQAPFTGTFRPASPLSAFSGAELHGTWTLTASDSTAFDTGSVRAFSIETRGFSCAPAPAP
jgi:subtilisin-like proprotein convertase family protein